MDPKVSDFVSRCKPAAFAFQVIFPRKDYALNYPRFFKFSGHDKES
jgi:hypothetical protein